ncbi:50S ribosomal protein L44e [archaeon]|nr:50S ribosomal protein L44e [archaeon]
MKKPKTTNRYCKFCKKRTSQKLAAVKTGTPSSLKRGSKYRMRKRGLNRGFGNKGKTSRGALGSWKRYGVKGSKKISLKYTCGDCKKVGLSANTIRSKKLQFE